ncbi:MAG: DUF134 domain-containing protein [Bacillota bacterium]|uniref:UPF0251 protein BR63_09700 n=1 Tax=Thermanaerosceptrum fracticalcis TaxID=1712410 RepID=A0A7G6E3A3_THEFR|nr:DUF134 domain-containing protein [Thermanaerosceptrum fracticalcis]QNB46557.1 DUF134 domain-containing protein [Thermanaerosceptrum fracticalcis]
MPRPPKCRRVEFEPQVTYFKPAGIPKCQLEELVLSVEEIEAIRLKDREGLEQEECAERMHVSRPTFQRILMSARSKIAEAITEGKAIKVEGGNYRLATRIFQCEACQYEFEVPFGQGCGREIKCPKCEHSVHRI